MMCLFLFFFFFSHEIILRDKSAKAESGYLRMISCGKFDLNLRSNLKVMIQSRDSEMVSSFTARAD